MGQYIATARSNTFEVKDPAVFMAWCASRNLTCWRAVHQPNAFAIAPDDDFNGDGWPEYEDEDGDLCEFDITELVPHLAANAVAILLEAGAEKLRYVIGFAEAIDATGKRISISLCDIYDQARAEFGADAVITRAEY